VLYDNLQKILSVADCKYLLRDGEHFREIVSRAVWQKGDENFDGWIGCSRQNYDSVQIKIGRNRYNHSNYRYEVFLQYYCIISLVVMLCNMD